MRAIILALFAQILTFQPAPVKAQNAYNSTQYIYACNQGAAKITVIDAQSHEVTATVDLQKLGFSANAKPHHVVAEADGSFWYVSLIGENRVLKFNRANELVDETEMEVPGLLALDPTTNILYVGRSMSAVNPPQSYAVIDRSDMELQEEMDLFFSRPHAITIAPGEDHLYVGSLSSNQFLAIDTETEEMELNDLEGGTHVLVNFAVSPDKKTLVATGQVTGKLLVFDLTNPMKPALKDQIDVDAEPWHPVFSPDGTELYFANKGANAVTVIDMNRKEVSAVIKGNGLAQPHGAALSQDGKYLFVTNNNMNGAYQPASGGHHEHNPGTVVIIDTETREIIKVIEVGMGATGIGTNAW